MGVLEAFDIAVHHNRSQFAVEVINVCEIRERFLDDLFAWCQFSGKEKKFEAR